MSSGSEGQHQDLNPVFLAHYPLSNTLEKTHRTGPLTGLGQVGSPQTQDFLRLHSDATAATSGSFRSESWGPAAPSLRLSVGVGGDQTRAAGHSCGRAIPSGRLLLSQHKGATCRAIKALPEQATLRQNKKRP